MVIISQPLRKVISELMLGVTVVNGPFKNTGPARVFGSRSLDFCADVNG